MHMLALLTFKKTLWHLVRWLGGPGLIVLGLLDNSLIPMPGTMDAAVVILSAAHHEPWFYYAIMATLGSVIGGYLTYRIGVKGGKETLEKKLSKKRADQVYRIFSRYGFWSVVVGAATPPPMPIVPFLIAAGALQYPRRKFLGALALGRSVRYTVIAYLGSIYGRQILRWLSRYYLPLLYVLIGLAVISSLTGLYYWKRHKERERPPAGTVRNVA